MAGSRYRQADKQDMLADAARVKQSTSFVKHVLATSVSFPSEQMHNSGCHIVRIDQAEVTLLVIPGTLCCSLPKRQLLLINELLLSTKTGQILPNSKRVRHARTLFDGCIKHSPISPEHSFMQVKHVFESQNNLILMIDTARRNTEGGKKIMSKN